MCANGIAIFINPMNSANRNPYLVLKAMKSFLLASLLVNASGALTILAGSLFAGNYLGTDAVSIINLYKPIGLIEDSLYFLLATGSFILYSKYLGERNREKLQKTFSTSILSLFLLALLLSATFLLFGNRIFPLFCTDQSILQDFNDFALVNSTLVYVVNLLSALFAQILSIEGKPKVAIYSAVIILAVNLVCDYVFMNLCHFGIESIAYAWAIAFFCSLIYQAKHIVKVLGPLFRNFIPKFSSRALKDNIIQAIPKVCSYACITIAVTILNLYIQKESGENGLFAWSISSNILILTQCVVGAIGMTCLTLGSFYKGQSDSKGLRFISKRSHLCFAAVLALAMCALCLFPGWVAELFGARSAELIEYAKPCLRYCAILAPGLMLMVYCSNIFQLQGNIVLSTLCQTFYPLAVIACSFASGSFASPWMIFPVGGIAMVLLIGGCILISRRKRLNTKEEEAQYSFDISIKANRESFKASLQELSDSLKSYGLDRYLVFKVNVCVEEVMINITENSGSDMSNHYFDIHIAVFDKKVVCSIKDDNKAFNPIHIPEDERGMGLQIIFGLCPNIEYRHMYGQNMAYLSWEKD